MPFNTLERIIKPNTKPLKGLTHLSRPCTLFLESMLLFISVTSPYPRTEPFVPRSSSSWGCAGNQICRTYQRIKCLQNHSFPQGGCIACWMLVHRFVICSVAVCRLTLNKTICHSPRKALCGSLELWLQNRAHSGLDPDPTIWVTLLSTLN